jgi:octaprenyl-diphosphate synthase
MTAVNQIILKHMQSPVALIPELAGHIIAAGGKRLRPILTLASARMCGYREKHHRTLAACVEFIHTATLLHDDVVDESSLRRSQPTANALFGNAASVLVGDFVYSRAFQLMVEAGNMRVLEVLADATNVIAEGEVLQLMNCHNPHIAEEEYLRVIRCKTAKLFEAASRIGAILGGVGAAAEDDMARYGAHLGTAFQLIDDVLDYSGDHAVIGKNVGDDLAEGKPTLPLIYAMRAGSPPQVAAVRRAIEAGGLDELPAVLEAIRETSALDYARAKAREEAQRARDALTQLADSKPREVLLQLADFAVTRDF